MPLAPQRAAVVILAAGLSTRFGPQNKLMAPLDGRRLGLYAAETVAAIPFAARIAVIGTDDPGYAALGYRIVVNVRPALGLSRSLALGIAAAAEVDVDAALVMLGDMPRVPARHIEALLSRFDGNMLGTRSDCRVSPPAIFPRAVFPRLSTLEGDVGARMLLRGAASVDAHPEWLHDVDSRDDLKRLDPKA